MTSGDLPTNPAESGDGLASSVDGSLRASLKRSEQIEADLEVHPERYRMLTGDRPTGKLHLGHYFGSLVNRVRLQNLGLDSWVLIADYQVIYDRDGVGDLKANVYSAIADYLAVGIDPARSTIFAHSAVAPLNQLLLPFLSLVTDAELRRNPTVKDELANSDRPMSGLMLTFPVHQAADILFCKANIVPVGNEQIFDRLGLEEQYMDLLGVKVPAITIPVRPGRNLAIILEVAAMNNRQKKMGYNAAAEFTEQINRHFDETAGQSF